MEEEYLVDPGGECAKKTNCYIFRMAASCTPEAEVKYYKCLAEREGSAWGDVLQTKEKIKESKLLNSLKPFIAFALILTATAITFYYLKNL